MLYITVIILKKQLQVSFEKHILINPYQVHSASYINIGINYTIKSKKSNQNLATCKCFGIFIYK